jgi:hypothetical protein
VSGPQTSIADGHSLPSCCGAPSLTRGRVCNLLVQFSISLRSKSNRTHNHILISCLKLLGSLFVASYDSQGHGGGIQTRLHTALTQELYPTVTSHLACLIPYTSTLPCGRHITAAIDVTCKVAQGAVDAHSCMCSTLPPPWRELSNKRIVASHELAFRPCLCFHYQCLVPRPPCGIIIKRRFGGTCRLHLQSRTLA